MIYNEYAQVLEAKNPTTGKLYTPEELNVIDWNKVGTAMLQDAIWADTNKLARTPTTRTPRSSSLKASIEGWVVLPRQRREVPRHRGGRRARSSATATSCGR